MSTKAFEAKRALRDLLKADAGLKAAKVDVTYGFPSRTPPSRWAYVGGIAWGDASWTTSRARQEQFGVRVILNAQVRDTPEVAEALLESMAAGVEDALKADPSLGGLCVSTSFEIRRMDSWPIDNATEGQIEAEVSCLART